VWTHIAQPCVAYVKQTDVCCAPQVATKVDEGVKQLVQAEKTQKQSRTILCIVFLLVAVIFMLFIIVFKAIFF